MDYIKNQQLMALKTTASYRSTLIFMVSAALIFSSIPANGYPKGDIILTASCILLATVLLHTNGVLNTLIDFLIRYDSQPRQDITDQVKEEVSNQVIGFNVIATVIAILAITLMAINRVVDPLFYPDAMLMIKLVTTVFNVVATIVAIDTSPINILNKIQKEN